MVGHAGVLALVSGGGFKGEIQITVRDGLHLVHYSAPRLWFYREAWEKVPTTEGGLVLRVEPGDVEPFHLVFSLAELRAGFGHITETRSWESPRHYHWSRLPYRAVPFTTPPRDRDRVLRFAESQ